MKAWENVLPASGERTQLSENFNCLLGQRNDVWCVGLGSDIPPLRRIKVNICPARATQLTWARKQQGRELQRSGYCGTTFVTPNGT